MKDVQNTQTVGGSCAPKVKKAIKIDKPTAEASFWALGERMRGRARFLKSVIRSLNNQPQTVFDFKYRNPEEAARLEAELRSLAAMRRKFSEFVWPSLFAEGCI